MGSAPSGARCGFVTVSSSSPRYEEEVVMQARHRHDDNEQRGRREELQRLGFADGKRDTSLAGMKPTG